MLIYNIYIFIVFMTLKVVILDTLALIIVSNTTSFYFTNSIL